MERETKIITTPLGHNVELKTFLTQAERGQVQKILAGDSRGSDEPTHVALIEASQLALKLAVVAIDENKDTAYETIINTLPTSEYDAIIAPVLDMIRVDLAKAK